MGPPSPSRHSSVGPAPLSRSYGAFPGLPEPSPDLTGRGPPAWSPRSLDCSLLGVEMDNRQQRPQRKMLQWQVTQEPGQQSFPDGPSATSVQPDTESNPWKDLQTQDWGSPETKKRMADTHFSPPQGSLPLAKWMSLPGRKNEVPTAGAVSSPLDRCQSPLKCA
ncbi:testis-expressed protein 22 isoform X3 [Nannospalax galili]|uniref:testis-expressed protein 22 isoform X3 n=1 Tax=Nannospalax galili TaxID=1026970 RepID=UPI00111C39D4|nr:testis-expressed protein 22 isoform X3 [Nannospalax galili]